MNLRWAMVSHQVQWITSQANPMTQQARMYIVQLEPAINIFIYICVCVCVCVCVYPNAGNITV